MRTMNPKLQANILNHLGSTPGCYYSVAGRNTIAKVAATVAVASIGCMRFAVRSIVFNSKPAGFDTLASPSTASSAGTPFLSRGLQDSTWFP